MDSNYDDSELMRAVDKFLEGVQHHDDLVPGVQLDPEQQEWVRTLDETQQSLNGGEQSQHQNATAESASDDAQHHMQGSQSTHVQQSGDTSQQLNDSGIYEQLSAYDDEFADVNFDGINVGLAEEDAHSTGSDHRSPDDSFNSINAALAEEDAQDAGSDDSTATADARANPNGLYMYDPVADKFIQIGNIPANGSNMAIPQIPRVTMPFPGRSWAPKASPAFPLGCQAHQPSASILHSQAPQTQRRSCLQYNETTVDSQHHYRSKPQQQGSYAVPQRLQVPHQVHQATPIRAPRQPAGNATHSQQPQARPQAYQPAPVPLAPLPTGYAQQYQGQLQAHPSMLNPQQQAQAIHPSQQPTYNIVHQSGNVTALVTEDTPTIYESLHDAMQYRTKYTWNAPQNDESLPKTDVDRQNLVRQLIAAISRTDTAIDQRDKLFRAHWEDNGVSSLYHSDLSKEHLAWYLLHLLETLHTTGPNEVFFSFDTKFWDIASLTQHWKFYHRFKMVLTVLTKSKARVEKLMCGKGVQDVVANPKAVLQMITSNKTQNGRRGRCLNAAKEAGVVFEGVGKAARRMVSSNRWSPY